MSRHHQQHRRRTYGRRQHEVRERRQEVAVSFEEDVSAAAGFHRDDADEAFVPFGMPGPRLRWAEAR